MATLGSGDRQPIVKVTTVIATGLASAGAAFLTSRFGIAGTVLGTAITVMLITAGASIIEVYLETAAHKVRVVPSGSRGGVVAGTAAPALLSPRTFFARFAALSRSRRRSVLVGAFAAAAASFLIGMGVVTGVELSAGKSLTCLLWDECPGRVADGGTASDASTRPSMVGGGSTAGSDQPGVPAGRQPAHLGPPGHPQQQSDKRPLFDDDPRSGLSFEEPTSGPTRDATVPNLPLRLPDPTGEPVHGRPGDKLGGPDLARDLPSRPQDELRLGPGTRSSSEGADGGA